MYVSVTSGGVTLLLLLFRPQCWCGGWDKWWRDGGGFAGTVDLQQIQQMEKEESSVASLPRVGPTKTTMDTGTV